MRCSSCSSFSSLIVDALNCRFLKLEVHDVLPNCNVENAQLAESWGELWLAAHVIQLLHNLCIMHVIANIVSTLGTGDIAIVGNLHPSLENNTYHSVHDVGLQLVGHFYLVERELSPASLIYTFGRGKGWRLCGPSAKLQVTNTKALGLQTALTGET
jgi:hypothetical protein